MKEINIRIGEKRDIPAIYALVVELAVYEKEPDAVLASLEDYRLNWEEELYFFSVAEVENKIVGMALYYMTYSTWKGRMLYLEDFVVTESYRRYGIGQLLFDAVIKEAKSRNCALLKWQVLDWNEPAIKFYKKNDSIIEKEWWNVKIVF